jgi:hypothetical protein
MVYARQKQRGAQASRRRGWIALDPKSAIEMRDITKTFGQVAANSHISLDIHC